MVREPGRRLERYRRPARWLHAAVYLATFVLLGTGWWLLLGHESLAGVVTHKDVGWGLAALGAALVLLRPRAVGRFLRRSLQFDRGDGAWFAAWPWAALSGRFAPHRRHFDPGQRIANLVLTAGLALLVLSGVGLVLVHGGPAFVWLARVHRLSTWAITPVIVGHVLIASGVLPGYRGAWRSMHTRHGVTEETARRLWPATAGQPDTPAPAAVGRRPSARRHSQ
ncbi:MAG TPA: cytochrome b/b6 domain-containing protein [Actinomycetes bacterium]|jgi:formate dehydrogenase subunit gamma|nr:cytochrome b/b6 domain-containing protein [Actinomycetes bacterium]